MIEETCLEKYTQHVFFSMLLRKIVALHKAGTDAAVPPLPSQRGKTGGAAGAVGLGDPPQPRACWVAAVLPQGASLPFAGVHRGQQEAGMSLQAWKHWRASKTLGWLVFYSPPPPPLGRGEAPGRVSRAHQAYSSFRGRASTAGSPADRRKGGGSY